MKSFRHILWIVLCVILSACGNQPQEMKEMNESLDVQPSVAANDESGEKETGDDAEAVVSDEDSTGNTSEHTINISSSDKGAGYVHGNPANYHSPVCSDGDWVYAVQDIILEDGDDYANGSAIVRFRKDGTDMKTLYEFPQYDIDNRSRIFCLNVRNDWIVFLLTERINTIESHYICKMKTDGTHFERLLDAYVYDMWLYKNRIYFSFFTKWGGSDIYSMDMNGEDLQQLVEEKQGLEFEVANNKIYAFYSDDNTDGTTDDYQLYEMDLKGCKKEKLMEVKDAFGDSLCLWGNSVFYLNGDEQLCKQEIGNTEAVVILSMEDNESEYRIYDDYIYYIDDDLYRISVDGKDLRAYDRKDIVKKIANYDDWGIFDGRICVKDLKDNLLLIGCDDGNMKKVKLKIKKISK